VIPGEMFGFYYQIVSPYLTYQVFSKEGVLMESVPITVRDNVVMHDFAITENYAIVMDLSLVIKFKVYSLQSILPLCKRSL
jgi:carotenoid cleavage dioxygenase